MVPWSRMFPLKSRKCGVSNCVLASEIRSDEECPLNVAIWRLLVSLVSGTGLDRIMGKEAGFGKCIRSE